MILDWRKFNDVDYLVIRGKAPRGWFILIWEPFWYDFSVFPAEYPSYEQAMFQVQEWRKITRAPKEKKRTGQAT